MSQETLRIEPENNAGTIIEAVLTNAESKLGDSNITADELFATYQNLFQFGYLSWGGYITDKQYRERSELLESAVSRISERRGQFTPHQEKVFQDTIDFPLDEINAELGHLVPTLLGIKSNFASIASVEDIAMLDTDQTAVIDAIVERAKILRDIANNIDFWHGEISQHDKILEVLARINAENPDNVLAQEGKINNLGIMKNYFTEYVEASALSETPVLKPEYNDSVHNFDLLLQSLGKYISTELLRVDSEDPVVTIDDGLLPDGARCKVITIEENGFAPQKIFFHIGNHYGLHLVVDEKTSILMINGTIDKHNSVTLDERSIRELFHETGHALARNCIRIREDYNPTDQGITVTIDELCAYTSESNAFIERAPISGTIKAYTKYTLQHYAILMFSKKLFENEIINQDAVINSMKQVELWLTENLPNNPELVKEVLSLPTSYIQTVGLSFYNSYALPGRIFHQIRKDLQEGNVNIRSIINNAVSANREKPKSDNTIPSF